MTRPKIRRPRVLTTQQARAQAKVLNGSPSRVALAAAGDDVTTVAAAADPMETNGELWLYGVVGGWWRGFNAESVANALRGLDVDVLYVRIHSPGGYAADGIAIGNLLRNHTARVVVVVDGMAASAASVIAVAGDEVVMCPGSQFMLHDASTFGYGNADALRAAADWINGQSENYAGVYAYRAGGTAAEWRTVMLANGEYGTWYTADAAVEAGLADRVGTVTAVGSPPVAPDDGDDWDDDMLARAAHDLQILEQCVHPAARAAWCGEKPAIPAGHPKPPNASAIGSPHTEGGSAVALSPEQITMRQKLGVAEDADEATTLAALTEALDERAEPTAAATTNVPEGHVVIPAAKLADLEAGAAAGTASAKALRDQEREAFLDANRTKFVASNRAAWAKEYDRSPEGTREHFAQAPELIPTSELGHGVDEAPTEAPGGQLASVTALADVTESDEYKNWSM